MSNLVNEYCLNCKKSKCNGNCKELRAFTKSLVERKIIPKRGGKRTVRQQT